MTAAEEFFKITVHATGEVRYEPRAGRAPSDRMRELRETHGTGASLGITAHVPAAAREAAWLEAESFRVGERVVCRKYGRDYAGTVVYVGARGRVTAEFVTDGFNIRRAERTEIRKAAV